MSEVYGMHPVDLRPGVNEAEFEQWVLAEFAPVYEAFMRRWMRQAGRFRVLRLPPCRHETCVTTEPGGWDAGSMRWTTSAPSDAGNSLAMK